MMIDDDLLELYASEYTRKSTSEWGMSFQEYLDFKIQCDREVNQTLLEVNNGEKN